MSGDAAVTAVPPPPPRGWPLDRTWPRLEPPGRLYDIGLSRRTTTRFFRVDRHWPRRLATRPRPTSPPGHIVENPPCHYGESSFLSHCAGWLRQRGTPRHWRGPDRMQPRNPRQVAARAGLFFRPASARLARPLRSIGWGPRLMEFLRAIRRGDHDNAAPPRARGPGASGTARGWFKGISYKRDGVSPFNPLWNMFGWPAGHYDGHAPGISEAGRRKAGRSAGQRIDALRMSEQLESESTPVEGRRFST